MVASMLISFLVVLLFGCLLAFFKIIIPQKEEVSIVVYNQPAVEDTNYEKKVKPKQKQKSLPKPAPSSQPTKALTVAVMGDVAIAETTTESFGTINDFEFDSLEIGESMFFEEDTAVEAASSFFGVKLSSQRIAYVIDYSASMAGKRQLLMRKELSHSLENLKGSGDYSLIFFSGPVWQAGDRLELKKRSKEEKQPRLGVVKTGKGSYKWEAEKHSQDWQPQKKVQKMKWSKITTANIKKSVKHVQETRLYFGTHWHHPLKMALELDPKPDVIVFMTDGSSGKESLDIAKDMGRLAKRKGITVNTIALMEPTAVDGMIELATRTGGSAVMVKEDEEVVDLTNLTKSEIKKLKEKK